MNKGAKNRMEGKRDKPQGKPPEPTAPPPHSEQPIPMDVLRQLAKSAFKDIQPVELKCDFIQVRGWFIDLAKVWHAHIDSGHIVLAQLGGGVLIFENEEKAADLVPGANALDNVAFVALGDFLKERFKATDVMTPVDKTFGGDSDD